MLSKTLIADTFSGNMDRCETLCSVFEYSQQNFPPALDCDDLLRSAVLMSVSSLDLLMHDLIRYEVQRRLAVGQTCDGLQIPFDSLGLPAAALPSAIDSHVVQTNAHRSFVAPEKIAQSMTPFVPNLWQAVANTIGTDAQSLKNELREVVRWRNRIAHQADINPVYGGTDLFDIEIADVRTAISIITIIGHGISDTL